MWLFGKCDFQGNVTSGNMWLPGKRNFLRYSLCLDNRAAVLDLKNWTNKQIELLRGLTEGYWLTKWGVDDQDCQAFCRLLSIHVLAMVFYFICIAHKKLGTLMEERSVNYRQITCKRYITCILPAYNPSIMTILGVNVNNPHIVSN